MSRVILKQRYPNFAPEMYITNWERKWRRADSHSNTYRDWCYCFGKLGVHEIIESVQSSAILGTSKKAIAKQHIDQPNAVSDHFTLPAHCMDDIESVPLELITSNRDAIRKARAAFLISKGKTLKSLGLNRRDEI